MSRFFDSLIKFLFGSSPVRRSLTTLLAGAIVFVTTYAMVLPALTLEAERAVEEPGIVLGTAGADEPMAEEGAEYFFEDGWDAEENGFFEDGWDTDRSDYYEDSADEEYSEDSRNAETADEADYTYAEEAEDSSFMSEEAGFNAAEETAQESEIIEETQDAEDVTPEEEASTEDFEDDTEEILADGAYVIIRETENGYAAMAADGSAVSISYDEAANTAEYAGDAEIMWTKEGSFMRNGDFWLNVSPDTVGKAAVSDIENACTFNPFENGRTSVYTKSEDSWYCLVLSADETYFTAIEISEAPVNRVIIVDFENVSSVRDAAESEATEPIGEEMTETTESAAEEMTEAAEEESVAEEMTETTESIPEETTEAAESVAEETTEAAESAAEEMTETTESAAEETTEAEAAESIAEEITETTESVAEEMTETTESVAEEMTETTESAAEEMTEAEAAESFAEEVAEMTDSTESMPEEIADWTNSTVSTAEDVVDFGSTDSTPESVAETNIEEMAFPEAGVAGEQTFEGEDFTITAVYDETAGLPADAKLAVEEILPGSDEYDVYLLQAEMAVSENEFIGYARFFDICFVVEESSWFGFKNTREIEPASGVSVTISFRSSADSGMDNSAANITEETADSAEYETANEAVTSAEDFSAAAEVSVLHFTEENVDILSGVSAEQVTADEMSVSFTAESFSVYGIVGTVIDPETMDAGWNTVQTMEEFESHASCGLYIGHILGYYFTDGITNIKSNRTGITKTKPAQSYPASGAVPYFFEKADGETDQFFVYYKDSSDVKHYVRNTGNNSLSFTINEAEKTAFTVSLNADGCFTLNNGAWYWNMQGGVNGASFAAYNTADDVNNQMYFWYCSEITEDPYQLDGTTYGLMSWNGGVAGKALMAASSAENSLDAKVLTVMTSSAGDKLFAPADSEISMWTFHWAGLDQYTLSAVADGSTKYLKADQNGLSLVSDENEAGRFTVVPGTGVHAGEICLKAGETTLTYSGKAEDGFSVGGSVGSEWLMFVELSELTEDYFMTYSARKVSVSDPEITDGSKLIIYTRSWNESKKKYDFYAVNHDGSLVTCFESGDSVEWVGGQINTLLWNLVEYYYEGTTEPNYYYELFNQYSENYIAPQVTGGQILSDDTIGINLDGRRNGRYYTSILAWDEENYAYAGLKVEDGKIVSCPKSGAMDFYFAVVEEMSVDDELHTVATVDNTQYGITMKMIDIATRAEMSDFLGNDKGGVGTVLYQGLLSTDLGDDGYPTASGVSLGSLYSGAEDVNHLFIESIYRASGYYEFDSSQNFASLENGNFRVYKELGSYDSGGNKPTLKHGQFFPYNDLEPGVFASVNGKNLYYATADELPDGNPRKNEQLYLIKDVDCYFAMELEASFEQTPDGLDDWGHDIVFEFSGDDDFWLYVDGELVIDLGGIHSAVPGTVNFRTGEVNVNGTMTTLKDLFYSNYVGRGHTAAEALSYVEGIFTQNADGQWVFKNNTSHTMRIFYMERGAGASNLHMRFNLASIRPGTVLLSKELSGVDASESVLAEFPYQIKYKKAGDDTEYYLKNAETGDTADVTDYVLYRDTVNPVKYEETFTLDGITYNDVFFLKPGETAEISFPVFGEDNEQIASYSIVECGVNTYVYSSVYVNGNAVQGTAVEGTENRSDFGIDYAATADRPSVTYTNAVNPEALRTLTITKELYDETGEHSEEHELKNDPAVFSFRLYLATEFDENLNDAAANMHTYHVKDQNGNYCRWNAAEQRFESVGVNDYDSLTEEQKASVSFTTSMNGAVSGIPAFYTVEVRNVLAGTRYRVEERPWEIPDGYSFQEYGRDDTAGLEEREGAIGVVDTVTSNRDSHVDVCNLKGWGLRMNKIWTDAEYMSGRDAAYFAVYVRGGDEELTLAQDSVKELAYGETSLYWYFLTLPVAGTTLDQYVVREVTVSGSFSVSSDGTVTGYDAVTEVKNGEEVVFEGTQKGESAVSEFTYTVTYDNGTIEEGSNVRVDTVTNDRPGIIIKKTEWDGETALAGAVFTLTDEEGEVIGTFTSDQDGLVTAAYLRENTAYTLTEVRAPQGFRGLSEPVTIRRSGNTVTVSGQEPEYYVVPEENEETFTLIIKNRPYTLQAVKKDGDTNAPMQGVKFALHRQVTVDGVTTIDLNPMPGYESLETDADGCIPKVDNTLPAGTYELREKETLAGYQVLAGYIRFSVSAAGTITAGSLPAGVTFEEEAGDALSYTLTITNRMFTVFSVRKADDDGRDLTGAKFSLLCENENGKYVECGIVMAPGSEAYEAGGTSCTLDLTEAASASLKLKDGKYKLVETQAPDGYIITSSGFYFRVSNGAVSIGSGQKDISLDGTGLVITITNHAGYELPSTGGAGTCGFYIVGAALMLAAALVLAARRVREAE